MALGFAIIGLAASIGIGLILLLSGAEKLRHRALLLLLVERAPDAAQPAQYSLGHGLPFHLSLLGQLAPRVALLFVALGLCLLPKPSRSLQGR